MTTSTLTVATKVDDDDEEIEKDGTREADTSGVRDGVWVKKDENEGDAEIVAVTLD